MLASQSGQVGMFDAVVLVRPLPEGSFFALLAEHGDRIVRDSDFVDCYSQKMGRLSIPPSQRMQPGSTPSDGPEDRSPQRVRHGQHG
jgi:hypothetical protein